jgi:quinolinate synthase
MTDPGLDVAAQQAELRRLAAERNALILAHNYQRPEVQDAADFVGDSLELSRRAAATDAEVILFCGVRFMAETAHLLAPEKTVQMPETRAGCPMANMVTAADVRMLREQHPEAAVVAYVNTNADVKAEVDVCCTSANAVDIVARFPREQPIIFVPDRHLGDWIRRQSGRDNMIVWQGYCPVHDIISAEDVLQRKEEHREAKVMAHPECPAEVLDLADAVKSTSGMLRYPDEDQAPAYIVATEVSLLHRLRALHPDREFVPASDYSVCANMKLTTLRKAIEALRDGTNTITLPPELRERARRAVERMVE